MIEAWGRSFEKIREACTLYDGPLPDYQISETGIMVLCNPCDKYMELLHGPVHHLVHFEQDDEQDVINAITKFCVEPKTAREIVEHFNLTNRLYLKRHYLDKMLEEGHLRMTLPDKPKSKNQKYYS